MIPRFTLARPQFRFVCSLFFFLLGMTFFSYAQVHIKPKFNESATEVVINDVTYPVSMLDSNTVKFLRDKINNEADLLNNKGVKAFYAKDYSLALRMFKEAIKVRPHFKEAIFNAASVQVARKKYSEALEFYDQLLLDESTAEIWYLKGTVAMLKEDYDQATKDFKRALSVDGTHSLSQYEIGVASMKLGYMKDALKAFEKAIAMDSKNAMFHYAKGKVNLKLTEYRDAILDFDEAIKQNKKFDKAYAYRGMAEFQLHEYTKAISDFDEALKANPKNITALLNRAVTKHQVKDYIGALADCNKVIELDPAHGVGYLNRGIAKLIMGDSAGACADWKKALDYGVSDAKELIEKNCN